MRPDTNLKNLKATGVTKAAHWEAEKGGSWEGVGTFPNRLNFPMGHMELALSHSEGILTKRAA